MPEVDGKKYAYTEEGMNQARKEMLKKRTEPGPRILKDRKTLKKSSNRDAVTKSNPIKGY
jgi:hypothetical protein